MEGVLTAPEAAELWDEWLLTPNGEERSLPRHLYPACERLNLWARPVEVPRQ
jgi:hypothetical protein